MAYEDLRGLRGPTRPTWTYEAYETYVDLRGPTWTYVGEGVLALRGITFCIRGIGLGWWRAMPFIA